MLCITPTSTNPYINLATEDYLLHHFREDIFMLWINEPSVVIGKHQNAFAEINQEHVYKQNIKVSRRISGGGTVFHDFGNLNFSFILNAEKGKQVDFRRYSEPILQALHQLNIQAEFSGRNDFLLNGKKISGQAEHVYRNRVLHHGTLLFSSVLDDLRKVLNGKVNHYQSKAVQSVRSKVTNISEYISIDIPEFKEAIRTHTLAVLDEVIPYSLSIGDLQQIERIAKEKYKTREWIYGYSPGSVYTNTIELPEGELSVKLKLEKARIKEISFQAEFVEQKYLRLLEKRMTDEYFLYENIIRILQQADTENTGLPKMNQILELLF